MDTLDNRNDAMSDEELMSLVAQRDVRAFDVLYARYSRPLLAYFFRMLGGDEEKSQDFLQDLFLKVIEKSTSYRSGARFSTWLFTIAHNMCKNEYRRMQVRGICESLSPGKMPVENDSDKIAERMDFHRFQKQVEQQLQHLNQNQRSTFLLRFQTHLSIREISEVLNCSEGTTRSRLFYALRKLSGALQSYHPFCSEVIVNEKKSNTP